jgi:hypothetical protein
LKRLRRQPTVLRTFVENYVVDLANFFSALRTIIRETQTEPALFKLFCVLNVSATLYPLIIRLRERNALNSVISNNGNVTLLSIVETTDIRIYKTRGTVPARDVFMISRRSNRLTVGQIANGLRRFVIWGMDDAKFRMKLDQDIYGNNGALNRILVEVETDVRVQLNEPVPTINVLSEMRKQGQTLEHILNQTPNFGFPSYGFADEVEYALSLNCLGNLTLLESPLNSRCRDRPIESKIREPDLYHASDYRMTKRVAAAGAARDPVFSKTRSHAVQKILRNSVSKRGPYGLRRHDWLRRTAELGDRISATCVISRHGLNAQYRMRLCENQKDAHGDSSLYLSGGTRELTCAPSITSFGSQADSFATAIKTT